MGGDIGFRSNSQHRGSIVWFTAKLGKADSIKTSAEWLKKIGSMTILASLEERTSVEAIAPRKFLLLGEDNPLKSKGNAEDVEEPWFRKC